MATFCIPKFQIDTIREKLKSGEWEPGKLSQLSSAERRAEFARLIGEKNAKEINALFESKLLLKNQKLGMINWAKKILGISETAKRDIISKIERLDRVITGAELDTFLEDLVSKRLGFEVTFEEAGKLLQSTKEIEILKKEITPDMPDGAKERLDYGVKVTLLKKLVEDLKLGNRNAFQEFIKAPISEITNLSKGLRFTLDNSFWGNQGIGVLTSIKYTDLWVKNTIKSIKDIIGTLAGKDMALATDADIFSRKNALNGKYKDSGLAVGIATEEAFPSSVLSKIPLIKRISVAAETAYNSGAKRLRADIFDRVIRNREKYEELSKEDLRGLGEATNVLTGRASLGSWEGASKDINLLFTSAKFVKSQFDTLTFGILNKKIRGSNLAVKESAMNLAGQIMGTATLMVLINNLWPGSVETDPRSSDFGKIKIPVGGGKYARVGFTGGKSSMIVLAARLATNQIKTGGKLKEIGKNYGDPNRLDYFFNYLTGKFSPIPGAFATLWKGRTFEGEKPTIGGEAFKTILPLSIESSIDLMKEENADALLYVLLNGMGFNTNIY